MTQVDYVVVGLGALGSGAAWQLATRGHSVRGARAVRARARARRLPRHLPDPAAQLPHAGLRAADPGGVRRLGAAGGGVGGDAGHRRRRARPVPARLRDQPGRLRRLAARGRDRLRGARRRRDPAPLAAVPPAGGHARAVPGARRDRAGRARHGRDAAPRDRGRCHAARLHAGDAGDRPRLARRGRGWEHDVHLSRCGGRCRRLDQPGAGRPGRRGPADGHAGAADVLRSRPIPRRSRTCRSGSGWTSRPTTASPVTARRR